MKAAARAPQKPLHVAANPHGSLAWHAEVVIVDGEVVVWLKALFVAAGERILRV